MTYPKNDHQFLIIIDTVDYSVISLPDPPQTRSFDLFHSPWSGAVGQTFNSVYYGFEVSLWQPVQIPLNFTAQFNPVH